MSLRMGPLTLALIQMMASRNYRPSRSLRARGIHKLIFSARIFTGKSGNNCFSPWAKNPVAALASAARAFS